MFCARFAVANLFIVSTLQSTTFYVSNLKKYLLHGICGLITWISATCYTLAMCFRVLCNELYNHITQFPRCQRFICVFMYNEHNQNILQQTATFSAHCQYFKELFIYILYYIYLIIFIFGWLYVCRAQLSNTLQNKHFFLIPQEIKS